MRKLYHLDNDLAISDTGVDVQQKRKAEKEEDEDEDEDVEPEEAKQSRKKARKEGTLQGPEALDEDTIAMNKASMKRKDRNLYQSILNRQAAKRQKVTKLQQKRAALQS